MIRKGLFLFLLTALFLCCVLPDPEFEILEWEASGQTVKQGEEINFTGKLLLKNPQYLFAKVKIIKDGQVVKEFETQSFKVSTKTAVYKTVSVSWGLTTEDEAGVYTASLSVLAKGATEIKTKKEIFFNVIEFGAPSVVVLVDNNNPIAGDIVTVDTSKSKAATDKEDSVKSISYSFFKVINGNEIYMPMIFNGALATAFGTFSFIAPTESGTYKIRVTVTNNSEIKAFGEEVIVVGDTLDPSAVEFGAAFGPKNYRFYHKRYDEMNAPPTEDNKHEVALKTVAARQLNVYGWKNDVVNAQLVVWSAPTSATSITIKKSSLVNDSFTIDASNIKISRLKYIFTNNTVAHYASGAVGDYTENNVKYDAGSIGLNYYADCLYATTEEEPSYKIEAKKFQPYWIQIQVPKEAIAGNYFGTIVVGFDELNIKLDVSLEVLNISVPDYNDREFVLHTWLHPQAMVHSYLGCFHDDLYDVDLSGTYKGAHHCGVSKDGIMSVENGQWRNKTKLWTQQHFDWYLPVLQELYKSGQRNLFINFVKDPWPNSWGHSRGKVQQTYYPYDDIVIWKCNGNTNIKSNWSVDLTYLKKYLDWAMDTKLESGEKMDWKWIDCVGPLVWTTDAGMRIFYYDTADANKYKIFATDINDNWQAVWEVFFTEFKRYLVERGWFEKVRISVDERGIDNLTHLNNRILSQEAFKHNGKMLKTSAAGSSNHNIHGVSNSNRIQFISFDCGLSGPNLTLGTDEFAKSVALDRRAYTNEFSGGNDTTFYTCVTTYPSHANNGLPAESQFLGWYAARLNFDGHLKWAFDSWSGPMVNPNNPELVRSFPLLSADNKIFPSGDASHIYPGDPNATKPFIRSSVRQELAKEGYLYYDKIRHLIKTYSIAKNEIDTLLKSESGKRATVNNFCGATGSVDYRGRKHLYVFSDKVDSLEAEFYKIVKKYVN